MTAAVWEWDEVAPVRFTGNHSSLSKLHGPELLAEHAALML
jgi:hypothetical protein